MRLAGSILPSGSAMFKYVFILCVGVAMGYGYGYSDAKKHTDNVVTRLVERVGGSNRGKYGTDLDKQAERVDKMK